MSVNFETRWRNWRRGVVVAARVPWSALLLWLAVSGSVMGQDLPFNSGSTGADGPFRTRLPLTPARWGQRMVFDAARGQTVLFGGGNASTSFSDTLVWNGTNWTLKSPATHPVGRGAFGLAYDAARQEVVLFGGYGGTYQNDTWSWNSTNWRSNSPAMRPSARYYFPMVFDSLRQEIILFGGAGVSGALRDTWGWNGTNWSLKATNGPSARYAHEMAFDEARGEVVMFGGVDAGGNPFTDTWSWDGTNWRLNTATAPAPRYNEVMVYDSARGEVLMFGGLLANSSGIGTDETWVWTGTNWFQRIPNNSSPQRSPPARDLGGMAYDSSRQLAVLYGGRSASRTELSDTWLWDGTNWVGWSGIQTLDLRTKPDGVWNFTTIDILAGTTLVFLKNQANTPVRLLASGDVNVNGVVDLSGGTSVGPYTTGLAPSGGPGGYAGGLGGSPYFVGGSYAGRPGQGPGGGLPGTSANQAGASGTYASSYGNPFIVPLVGGSGGGGSGSSASGAGFNGGGGGGAILVSSSRDIVIRGQILANGGSAISGGGSGAGGAIRLRADRITLASGASLQANNDGRIRLESYERTILGAISPSTLNNLVISAPVADPALNIPDNPLRISSVAGQNVVQPPGGDLLNPDVTFSAPGDITVTVQGQGIPDGTPVKLRVTMVGNVINKPAAGEPNVVLSGGIATFTVTVPRGRGTLQAFAEFTVQ